MKTLLLILLLVPMMSFGQRAGNSDIGEVIYLFDLPDGWGEIKVYSSHHGAYQGSSSSFTIKMGDVNPLVSCYNIDNDIILNGFTESYYDDEGNGRSSIGLEAKNAVLQFSSNYYKGLENGSVDEKVLDGYDLQLTSQIPYLHWANAFINSYKWEGEDRANIEGRKYGSELFLTPNLSLELAYDDKDLKALQDEYYAKIQFVYPPREGPTALNGASQSMWKEEKNMSDQLLTKVKRQNKIMVEFDGVATISRLD